MVVAALLVRTVALPVGALVVGAIVVVAVAAGVDAMVVGAPTVVMLCVGAMVAGTTLAVPVKMDTIS